MKRGLILLNFLFMICYADEELNLPHDELLSQALNHSVYQPNYFGLILGFLFVIGLIYLTGIVYKKLSLVKLSNIDNDANKINILNTVSLGQGKNLHIVKVNGKCCLIGSTQNHINHIKDIDYVEEVNTGKKDNAETV